MSFDCLLQTSRNAIVDETRRWKFPIPYILTDSLGMLRRVVEYVSPKIKSDKHELNCMHSMCFYSLRSKCQRCDPSGF